MTEKNILKEALRVVDGDRGHHYGHPLDNHGNTARFWTEYLKRKYGVEIDLEARDVCMMMVLLKVSRDANRKREDNLVDIAGYARNAQMIEEEEERRNPTLKLNETRTIVRDETHRPPYFPKKRPVL